MVAVERACECMRAWVCTFLCSQLHKWIHVVKVVTENYSCHAYPQTNSTYEPAFFLNTKQKALNLAIMLWIMLRIVVFVSAHLKRTLEVSLNSKDIYLAKIYSSLPTENIVVEYC